MTTTVPTKLRLDDLQWLKRWWYPYDLHARWEGWDIFDCTGSDYGRWQVNSIDCPDLTKEQQLETDEDAWLLLMTGSGKQHRRARQFLRRYNPKEWNMLCVFAGHKIDRVLLPRILLPEIIAATLAA